LPHYHNNWSFNSSTSIGVVAGMACDIH